MNYGTSLLLPIHGIHPDSQLGSNRQAASGITAVQPGYDPLVWVVRKRLYSSSDVIMRVIYVYSIEQMHCPLHPYKINAQYLMASLFYLGLLILVQLQTG